MKKFLITLTCLLFAGQALAANPVVRIETNLGNIEVELNAEKAPKSVENFLKYANEGFYNGTIFHRVIKNFMIQGGGFTTDYDRKSTHMPIDNEAFNGLANERGTIAMARTMEPHSATSQFFINTKNNAFLNHKDKSMRGWGYTVFGKVTNGMDVVDKIEASKTGAGGVFSQDVPQNQVVIQKVAVVK